MWPRAAGEEAGVGTKDAARGGKKGVAPPSAHEKTKQLIIYNGRDITKLWLLFVAIFC